jgi:hypothetical protein
MYQIFPRFEHREIVLAYFLMVVYNRWINRARFEATNHSVKKKLGQPYQVDLTKCPFLLYERALAANLIS